MHRNTVNIDAFIADHLDEYAKSIKVIIGGGGIITALAKTLGYGVQVDDLSILCGPGRSDLITCINMNLFKALNGGQLWLNHHGNALFALPNQAKTTITCSSNLVYDDDADGESRGKSGGDDDRSDDDIDEVPRGQSGKRRTPAGPSANTFGTTLLILLGPWVPPCFRWCSTVLISCKSKTRRSSVTSRTWVTWFTMHMSSLSGLTRHLIGNLHAPGGPTG